MINGISSASQTQGTKPPPPPPMTDDQETAVSDILSKYDSSSISSTEFESMMEEIKDAGIVPSKDLRSMLDEAGFEPPQGSEGPQGAKGSEQVEPPDFMFELMNKLQTGEVSEEEVQLFMQNLQNSSDSESGAIMDKYV